jgi:hypothetical protein
MYVFSWNRFHGGDTVWWLNDALGYKAWDLLHYEGDTLICLWTECTVWIEGSVAEYPLNPNELEVIQAWFVSERVLQTMHWFVKQWYTTYHHTVPLWLGWSDDRRWEFRVPKKRRQQGLTQYLTIFPDLWSLWALTTPEQRNASWHRVVHSRMSILQKKKLYRDVSCGKVTHLYATPSQIFFDWMALTGVIVHRQHQWWYKHQQEPRYDAVVVAEHVARSYSASYHSPWLTVVP